MAIVKVALMDTDLYAESRLNLNDNQDNHCEQIKKREKA